MTRQWLGLDRPPRLPLRTRPGASAPAPRSSAEICLGPAKRSRPPLWRRATRPPSPPCSTPALTALASVPRVHLSAAAVADSLRTAKKGAAAGLSGATAERYKLLLADEEALAQCRGCHVARQRDVPEEALSALALARLTALQKPGGGTRGIATGDAFRRLVARSLVRRYAARFDEATRPFQFALQARAGTDCLASMLRVAVGGCASTVAVCAWLLHQAVCLPVVGQPRRLPPNPPGRGL